MANSADPEKPTDLDLHCLQMQNISGSAGQELIWNRYVLGMTLRASDILIS